MNRRYAIWAVTLLATLLMVGSALASGGKVDDKTKVAAVKPSAITKPAAVIPNPVDEQLVAKYDHFSRFAKIRLRTLNNNHRFSFSRMVVEKMPDGSYKAKYHEIDVNSLVSQVRRSSSKSVPYVAVAHFKEHVYESYGATPEDCRSGEFTVVRIIPNQQIFGFRKGGWK